MQVLILSNAYEGMDYLFHVYFHRLLLIEAYIALQLLFKNYWRWLTYSVITLGIPGDFSQMYTPNYQDDVESWMLFYTESYLNIIVSSD